MGVEFKHKLRKKDMAPHSQPYPCAAGCGRPAVDKAVDYKEMGSGNFVETGRKYWCGSHRTPGTLTLKNGNSDPSDFEPISDMDDYLPDPPESEEPSGEPS